MTGEESSRSRRAALHLLWTVPLALVWSAPLFAIGTFMTCGISGCSGGGFGPSYGPDWQWALPFLLIGVLLGLAVGMVPWGSRRERLRGGLAVALIVGALLIAHGVLDKYPTLS